MTGLVIDEYPSGEFQYVSDSGNEVGSTEELTEILTETKQGRLEHHEQNLTDAEIQSIQDGDWPYTDPLLGECPQNAVSLCDRLYTHGYRPILVGGALRRHDADLAPPTMDGVTPTANLSEVLADGRIHWWVEIHTRPARTTVHDSDEPTASRPTTSDPPAESGDSQYHAVKLELCSEHHQRDTCGQKTISSTLPENYHQLPENRFVYHPDATIDTDSFTTRSGWESIRDALAKPPEKCDSVTHMTAPQQRHS